MAVPCLVLALNQLAVEMAAINGASPYTHDVQTVDRRVSRSWPSIADTSRPYVGIHLAAVDYEPLISLQVRAVAEVHLMCLLPRQSDAGQRVTDQSEMVDDIITALAANLTLRDGAGPNAISIHVARTEYDASDDDSDNALRAICALTFRRRLGAS